MHLPALQGWPNELACDAHGVHLRVPPPQRDAVLARVDAELRGQGLIRAWRDET